MLRSLLHGRDDASPAPELATIVAPRGHAGPHPPVGDDRGVRLRLFDEVRQLLDAEAARRPVVVVLDDLQWSDPSSLDLLRFLTGVTHTAPLLVVGAYRDDELDGVVGAAMASLLTAAEPVVLGGLSQAEVGQLVVGLAGEQVATRWAQAVYQRSGGHPLFARELSHALGSGEAVATVPAAVREIIARRLARVSTGCAQLLAAAAVADPHLEPAVLSDLTGYDAARIAEFVREAFSAGLLITETSAVDVRRVRFGHDLYRESIYESLAAGQRLDLHHRVAAALVSHHERGATVYPSELARHFAAAVPVAGPDHALGWARSAARAEQSRCAFAEAARHLARVRIAVTEAGAKLSDAELVDLLTTEADARRRAGNPSTARQLLDTAWTRARTLGEPALLATVALGRDRLGARFAMPRTELLAALDEAGAAVAGTGTAAEAAVTAALARQLQHSVPKDRPRARPLAEHAVALARSLRDPITLAGCLLALHDVAWTPGRATERLAIAREIAELADANDDCELHAEAVLLTANAFLEVGSPAFRVALSQYRSVSEPLPEPRRRYLLRTREAALALLEGDLDEGERLSTEAAELGTAVEDTDTENVRMAQQLEVVRARGEPRRLRDTAEQAVRWWVGVPAYAHAVAAGLLARAGDLGDARRELDTVLALDDWREDRSYLWPVYMGELTAAAVALDDQPFCQQLLDDLLPVADTCAVGSALCCFMGSNAHRVGLLYSTLGQPDLSRHWLQRALDTHRRLGARAWEAETCAALAALGGNDSRRHGSRARELADELGLTAVAAMLDPVTTATPAGADRPELRRDGDMWRASFHGRSAYLRDAKGLHDLAILLARPGVDVPTLELAGAAAQFAPSTDGAAAPVLDRAALVAYRRRIADLDEERTDAERTHDLGRERRAGDEREQLLIELRRATRPGGSSRQLGSTAAERARKAVSGRIRDAIRHIHDVLPELGAHLDRTIRTGGSCSYAPD